MDIGTSMRHAVLLFFMVLALAVGLSTPAFAQTPTGDPGLQPGDQVQITVWQRDELSGEFTVSLDGTLNHPLYRRLRVGGVSASQIEERVRSFLAEYEANPQVVVEPKYKVVLLGAVLRPDIYNLPVGTTVIQAVGRAGGVTEDGDREDVVLIRGSNEIELDLTEAQTNQMLVQSGDQIIVDQRSNFSFRQNIIPYLQMGITIAHLVYYTSRR